MNFNYSGEGRLKSQRKKTSCALGRGFQAGSNWMVASALIFMAISSNDNYN